MSDEAPKPDLKTKVYDAEAEQTIKVMMATKKFTDIFFDGCHPANKQARAEWDAAHKKAYSPPEEGVQ